jgi:hypothetical protein
MIPRAVLDSVAWRHASMRARVVLQVMLFHHDGWNNGKLAISVKQIGKALGNQNHAANGQALAELIELGFVECTSGADHGQSKARTYRLTFVSTGEGKRLHLATNEYQSWRPATRTKRGFGQVQSSDPMKFGGANSTTQNMKSVAETAAHMKFHDANTATLKPGIADFSTDSSVAEIAPHLINHLSPVPRLSPVSEIPPPQRGDSIVAPLDELRAWACDAAALGTAKALARDAGMPEATLSRFKKGHSLPDRYHVPLQEACGRALPYRKWKDAA